MKHILNLLIAAMLTLSSFVGCTSHVDLTADEIGPRSSGQVDRVVFTRSITGVVTDLGDTLQFDEHCGKYDHGVRAIRGRVDGGERKDIKLNQVKSVLMESEDLQGTHHEESGTVSFIRTARRQPWRKLNGKTVQFGSTVSLRKGSGIFSEDHGQFSGVTIRGDSVVVNTQDVFFQRTKYDVGKTTQLIAGVGLIAGGIIVVAALLHFRDSGSGTWY